MSVRRFQSKSGMDLRFGESPVTPEDFPHASHMIFWRGINDSTWVPRDINSESGFVSLPFPAKFESISEDVNGVLHCSGPVSIEIHPLGQPCVYGFRYPNGDPVNTIKEKENS